MGSQLDANSSAVRKRIEDHTFADEGGDEYEGSSFGGFADYMRRKKIKLQNLDAEIRASSGDNPPVFRGVVAHVNGYTQPSLQDLHRLIVGHGGGFVQYLDSKTVATHIIASSLTPKKREEFRAYRVVKPAWIVESINAGRLLPWEEYKVIDEVRSQKVLKFDSGQLRNHTNNPQAGYKDQMRSSWYASRIKATGVANQINSPSHPVQSGHDEINALDEPSAKPIDVAEDGLENLEHNVDEEEEHDEIQDEPPAVGNQMPPVHPNSKSEVTSEEYNAQLLSDPRMRASSVVNPDFLQQFYRESRLHHLSTWKADLKAQLQAAAKEKSESHIEGKKRVLGSRRYIIHVDFDCFFAAVSILKHPELHDKPVAIAHGTGTGSEIASCNYIARSHGVKNGMWMKGALDACPELKVLPYDFPAYEDASRKFYSSVLSIDGIVQSVSIDEALVDITSQCLDAGGTDGRGISEGSIYREQAKADEIAQGLRDSVKSKTGCAVSVGIGGNILLAKVALRKAKPAGQFQLKPESVLDFLGALTVQDLPGVGSSLGTKMEELGVKFVRDIRDLPRDKLHSTLGPKTGTKLWDYARGIDRTEVGNEVIRKSVSAEVNWGIRFINQAQADEFVQSLCAELHRRLVENLVKGKQLTLKVMRRASDAPLEPVKHLGHGKCDVFNKSVALGVASNATEILGKEAISMLKSFNISPGDLRGLGVQMTKLEPLKSGDSEKLESSQRQLNFKASPARKAAGRNANPDPDDLDSPHKGDIGSVSHGPMLNDSSQKPLNISGTQFILPSQPDSEVVKELPNDIRSRLKAQAKPREAARSTSPCPQPRQTGPPASAELPPQSQLDPETLAALPEDVRSEVLGYYNQPLASSEAVMSRPSSSGPSRPKRPTTPTKKRRGRPLTKAAGNMTLTNFVSMRPASASSNIDEPSRSPSRQPSPIEKQPEISEDFLAALPEDIRREVLEEHKRTSRMHQHSSSNITASAPRRVIQPAPSTNPPPPERRVQLPSLPVRPTFTSKKLSSLDDIRDEVSAWHGAFEKEGPFSEDVASLSQYLKRVVAEEKDVGKAVSVVKWLMWLVNDGHEQHIHDTSDVPSSPGGPVSWESALQSLQADINSAVDGRGLPPVDFDD